MGLSLNDKISLLAKLGNYISSESTEWEAVKEKTTLDNSWFIPEFVHRATATIQKSFLQEEQLKKWADQYNLSEMGNGQNKTVGMVLAGNLPAVGFHDFLCGFLSGHKIRMKLSSKDKILLPHFIDKLKAWEPSVADQITVAERLNDCDAYIATGSNNSARYFHQYFGKYPHIIRKNRTAVAVLNGSETEEELQLLADDVLMYFGRGCRNVTKIFVPEGYDFVPLMKAIEKYSDYQNVHHYKNNFDYQLSLLLLNKAYYLTNNVILLRQHSALFSPISVLNYEYYADTEQLWPLLSGNEGLQCIVGQGNVPFGKAQTPGLDDYADGVDTMAFLAKL